MNRSVAIIGLVVLALGSLPCAGQEGKDKDPRREKLLAARSAWYDAYTRGDAKEMDRLEAKDFLVIAGTGVQTKDEQLRGIRTRIEEKGAPPKGTAHVTEDLRVRFYGDSAVVTGRGWIKVPDRPQPPQEQYALSEVWVERDGTWSVAHLHFHPIPPP